MNLSVNPAVDLDETAPLLLGGVSFRLATLVVRQNRKITPRLPDIIEILNRRRAAMANVPLNEDGSPRLTVDDLVEKARALALSEAEWDMLIEFVAVGLSRCHPEIRAEDLLDLPIEASALLMAVDAVAAASHMVQKATDAAPGESPAASP